MTTHPASTHRGLRLFALCGVTLGLLLLAAAAFVLSYAGVHAVALDSGVSARLARLYPLILDAMVVVAGAAVLSLRSAGLPSRWYAWLTLLVLLAATAGADTLHAIGTKLPHKTAAAAAAIIPWALLLIGFGLLLTMLRHARLRADVRRATRKLLLPAGPEAALDEAAEPVPEAELLAEDEFQPEDEFQAEDEDDDEPEPGDDSETAGLADAEPGGFERVRSTPLPPGV